MKEHDGGTSNQPPHEQSVDSRIGAAFLGIHYKTLERMARKGEVPADKPGKSWQFLLSLLSEWRKERMNSNLNKHRLPDNHKQKENEDE